MIDVTRFTHFGEKRRKGERRKRKKKIMRFKIPAGAVAAAGLATLLAVSQIEHASADEHLVNGCSDDEFMCCGSGACIPARYVNDDYDDCLVGG